MILALYKSFTYLLTQSSISRTKGAGSDQVAEVRRQRREREWF